MKKVTTSIVTAALLALAVTTSAPAVQVGEKDNGFSKQDERTLSLYAQAHRKGCDVGRNITEDGYRHKDGNVTPATDAQVAAHAARLDSCVNPPPPPPAPEPMAAPEYGSSTQTYTPEAQTVAPASGGYSIPESIVMCESGGDWGAVNPSSGAGGAYQILPSTWAAYGGTGAPQDASPTEQSAIAAQIYADSGGSAWVC